MTDNSLITDLRKRYHEGKPVRILFVCLGNICRSPAAEGIFRYITEEKGTAAHFHLDSAGLYAGHAGELPTRECAFTPPVEATISLIAPARPENGISMSLTLS